MKKIIKINYEDIISIKNLFEAWQEFLPGKKNKPDVAEFALNLSKNIFDLHKDLKSFTYIHAGYKAFNISDPKPRNIHKARVRDRLLHYAIYKILYPYFDKIFVFDSYSCRVGKGTHRAINRFRDFGRKVSKNNTKQCWVLKCDIRKFFASVDQTILLNILNKHIEDKEIVWLLERVITSFNSGKEGIGLPLGNLTSQLLVNIYMNEFDGWMKRVVKEKYYMRYADDFVILSTDKYYLLELTYKTSEFLEENLKLSLHPNKVFIKTLYSGVDFLGWVHFPHHRVLRTATERKMMRNIQAKRELGDQEKLEATVDSYLGMLSWGNGLKLGEKIKSL